MYLIPRLMGPTGFSRKILYPHYILSIKPEVILMGFQELVSEIEKGFHRKVPLTIIRELRKEYKIEYLAEPRCLADIMEVLE